MPLSPTLVSIISTYFSSVSVCGLSNGSLLRQGSSHEVKEGSSLSLATITLQNNIYTTITSFHIKTENLLKAISQFLTNNATSYEVM